MMARDSHWGGSPPETTTENRCRNCGSENPNDFEDDNEECILCREDREGRGPIHDEDLED